MSVYPDPQQQQQQSGSAESTLVPCSQAQAGQPCIKDDNNAPQSANPLASPETITGDDQDQQAGDHPPSQPSPATTKLGTPPSNQQTRQTAPKTPTTTEQGTKTQPLEPQEPMTEFQRFVARSIGKRLPLFGYDLFQDVPSTFAPVDQVPVSEDYVIGPGDQIAVRTWGQVDINYKATVDRNGSIFLPKVGEISVAGVRYTDLNEHIRRDIARVFKNFELNVSLAHLRTITIYVVGQARRPGTYTVSSLSTLVNALFTSGGPNLSGSMRHLQLKRNDVVVTDLDLYDLLLRGDKSQDTRLQAGDVIYIPPVGAQAAITGSIRVPAIYELKAGESLDQLVRDAGGLSATAQGDRVIVERIDDHQVRHVDQFDLNEAGRKRELHDGDIVTVFPIQPRFDNAVTLRGNVAVPGRFPWHQGMRISDLIPTKNSLLTPDFWNRVNTVSQTRSSGQAQLRNDIERTAPEINWEYATVQRLNPDHLTTSLIPFNLGRAIDKDPSADMVLQSGDVVTVFSQADIRVPIEQQSKYVRLEGELPVAGVYKAEAGETLRHLLERSGGLTPHAYLYGAQLFRESTRREQQNRLDDISERFSQDVERSASYKSQNLTNPGDAYTLQAEVESQRRLAARLRTLKATGRIVMDIKPTDINLSAVPDLPLEDGDRLIIPYRPSTVSVLGAVYNQADFIYQSNGTVATYLRRAGGTTSTGDRRRMYIIRANGSVLGSSGSRSVWSGGLMGHKLYPGDALIVPEQITKTSFTKSFLQYTQILYQLGLGAAAIKVLAP